VWPKLRAWENFICDGPSKASRDAFLFPRWKDEEAFVDQRLDVTGTEKIGWKVSELVLRRVN
jgi:hypothetical protein